MKNLLRLPNLFLGFTLLLGLVSCSPTSSTPVGLPWAYADLRALDAVDTPSVPAPAADILAVYSRVTALSVELRVDILDINPGDPYLLRIDLRDNGIFPVDPLSIEISSTGSVLTSGIRQGMPAIWPRVVQDHLLDTVTVSLNRSFIGERFRLDVSSYANDPFFPSDEVLDVRSDAQPPTTRAPLLLAFWNTFPATTPIQALRRWDGAHTGPLGVRHGLVHILDAAGQNRIPVVLLDIKDPASLAALDFMDALPKIRDLNARGLLVLPDVAYGLPVDRALQFSRRAASGFGLPASQFIFAVSPRLSTAPDLPRYLARFLMLSDSAHLAGDGNVRLIPLPSGEIGEVTESGLSLDVRRSLFRTALSPDPADLVALGGSLPDSTWGNFNMVRQTFEWIAAHPWIQPLGGQDLLTFPVTEHVEVTSSPVVEDPWLQPLLAAPENAITQTAWQTYLTLTSPSTDSGLQALRRAYLGQVGQLLAAADWAEQRAPRNDCLDDLDGDGRAECILADQDAFAVLETYGARLSLFFIFDADGPHQVVGPSSQFAVGLSDPSGWHPEFGEAADPGAVMGAFMDVPGPWAAYAPALTSGGIIFTSLEGGITKSYRLIGNGMEVRYQLDGPLGTRIPLAVDPQQYYSGPVTYRSTLMDQSWIWGMVGGMDVEVRTDASLTADGFSSSFPFLGSPENPNLEYPKGMYLPFPQALVTIQSDGPFGVQIILKNSDG